MQIFNCYSKSIASMLLSLLIGSTVFFFPHLSASSDNQEVLTWVSTTHVPDSVKRAFLARIHVEPQESRWMVLDDDKVYVLSFRHLQRSLSQSSRHAYLRMLQTQSRQHLLLHAVGDQYEVYGMSNREAVVRALALIDGDVQGVLLSGLQSQSNILTGSVVSLLWIDRSQIVAFRSNLPSHDQLRPAYCKALYPLAKSLFLEEKHHPALQVYLEMRALKCIEPNVYLLDAAEIFLVLSQYDDVLKILTHLLEVRTSSLTSFELERVGDILLEIGNDSLAELAYNRALERLIKEM